MRTLVVFLVVLFSLLVSEKTLAQNPNGGWSLGFRGGTNLWVNDFNKRIVGPGGEIMARYSLARYFSLGLAAGYEELKSKQTTAALGLPYDYLKLHAFPASIIGWFHLAPGKIVSPYVYVGAGGMFYTRKNGSGEVVDQNGVVVSQNSIRNSIYIPFGVGLETFILPKLSIAFDLGYHVLDDYTEAYKFNVIDSYPTVKAGLNIYLGSSDNDDEDNDGLSNGEERQLGTNPRNPDTDGDGLKDGEEVNRYRTNPLKQDSDGDGLNDGEEVQTYHTDPLNQDTDGDGLSDGDEVLKYHTDPLKIDTDGDGLKDGEEVLKYHTDPLKTDTDGDGLSDWDEVKIYHTDPTKLDTDGDGLSDGEEVNKYHTDPLKVDTDGGGVPDNIEVKRGTNPLDPKDDNPKEALILERGKTVVLQGVNFATGSAVLMKGSERILERAYNALIIDPSLKVEIAGYTDNVGKADFNDRLSMKRADTVKRYLVSKGIGRTRLSTAGNGMREPIAPNTTVEGRAMNRRIEFHVQQ